MLKPLRSHALISLILSILALSACGMHDQSDEQGVLFGSEEIRTPQIAQVAGVDAQFVEAQRIVELGFAEVDGPELDPEQSEVLEHFVLEFSGEALENNDGSFSAEGGIKVSFPIDASLYAQSTAARELFVVYVRTMGGESFEPHPIDQVWEMTLAGLNEGLSTSAQTMLEVQLFSLSPMMELVVARRADLKVVLVQGDPELESQSPIGTSTQALSHNDGDETLVGSWLAVCEMNNDADNVCQDSYRINDVAYFLNEASRFLAGHGFEEAKLKRLALAKVNISEDDFLEDAEITGTESRYSISRYVPVGSSFSYRIVYIGDLGNDKHTNRPIRASYLGTTGIISLNTSLFTDGERGVDDGELSAILVHELMHAVQEHMVPQWKTGPEARWIMEGTASYFQELRNNFDMTRVERFGAYRDWGQPADQHQRFTPYRFFELWAHLGTPAQVHDFLELLGGMDPSEESFISAVSLALWLAYDEELTPWTPVRNVWFNAQSLANDEYSWYDSQSGLEAALAKASFSTEQLGHHTCQQITLPYEQGARVEVTAQLFPRSSQCFEVHSNGGWDDEVRYEIYTQDQTIAGTHPYSVHVNAGGEHLPSELGDADGPAWVSLNGAWTGSRAVLHLIDGDLIRQQDEVVSYTIEVYIKSTSALDCSPEARAAREAEAQAYREAQGDDSPQRQSTSSSLRRDACRGHDTAGSNP